MKSIHNETGFTLVELMIATAVFSVILLLCTFGLISIGRSYYKGVTITRTQEVARNIMDDLTQSIQFSGGDIAPSIIPPVGITDIDGFCINDRRYSFIIDHLLADSPTDHAFVVDDSALPCSGGLMAQNIHNANLSGSSKEFLLPNMRVAVASISLVDQQLYRVHIKIISGDDDSLEDEGTANVRCSDRLTDSQFCAVAELTSIVQKRIE